MPGRSFFAVFILIAVTAFGATGGPVLAAGCAPASQLPKVNFRHGPPAPSYNTSYSQAQIEQLALRNRPSHQVIGLTSTTWAYSIETAYLIQPRRAEGQYCVYLTGVNVDIGYQDTTVYIAREYRPGTCQFRVIRDHEKEHLKIFEAQLMDSLPEIRGSLLAAANIIGPMWTTKPEDAKHVISKRIQHRVNSHIERLERTTAQRQAAIDTAANYARVQALCPEW